MGIGFREEMRNGFLRLAEEDPERWIVIDNANNTIEQSLQRIFERVETVLKARGYKTIVNPGWAEDVETKRSTPVSPLAARVEELLSIEEGEARQSAAHDLFFEELNRVVESNPAYAAL